MENKILSFFVIFFYIIILILSFRVGNLNRENYKLKELNNNQKMMLQIVVPGIIHRDDKGKNIF